MYDYIKGTITAIRANIVTVEVTGIAYALHSPLRNVIHLQVGQEIKLFSTLLFREPEWTLFGFEKEKDRDLFNLLRSISGVGPKLALSLIGHLDLEDFEKIVFEEDAARLAQVPGVGKRTSERLVVELKGKLSSPMDISVESSNGQASSEAVQALMSLGYAEKEAQKSIQAAIKKATPDSLSTAELISEALSLRRACLKK